MVKAANMVLLKLSLGQIGENLAVMFKKLLLATLIVIIGLWGAGYNVMEVKHDIQSLADRQARTVSGQSGLDRSDWGPGAD